MNNILTPEHKDWRKFCDLLGGPEGCDFNEKNWKCKGGCDKSFSEQILKKYFPEINIGDTFNYFEKHGGYCDCEILFNVDK